jgi:hypothetical protein
VLLDLNRPVIPSAADQPVVTIAIPTKNQAKALPRAVASVLKQTYQNFELVVINDGGEDVAHLLPADPRIRYVNEPPASGVAGLWDRCFKYASGEFFVALADDDLFFPDHVARLVAALVRTGGVMARSMMATNILDTPSTLDPAGMLVRNTNGPALYRTRMLREHNQARAESELLMDLEMYLRHTEMFDFMCVRAVTIENDVHRDEIGADDVALSDAFPISAREHVRADRARFLDDVRLRSTASLMPAPARELSKRILVAVPSPKVSVTIDASTLNALRNRVRESYDTISDLRRQMLINQIEASRNAAVAESASRELQLLRSSNSWRLTKPLRHAARLLLRDHSATLDHTDK